MEDQAKQPPAAAQGGGRKRLRVIVGVVVGAGLIVLGIWWWLSRGYESTDDAQVEADIVAVPARTGGVVKAVDFEENQAVKADQVLVEIDDRPQKLKLAAAEADLAQAKAAAVSAEASRKNAETDLERQKQLVAQSAAPKSRLDAAQAAFDQARAQLAAAEARVQAAQQARDLAELDLSWTQVKAPKDGIASKKSVTVGQMLQTGQPVTMIVPTTEVWVVANFKETQLSSMRVGQPAEVTVDSYPGLHLDGKVESFSGGTGARFSLLPAENATGNFTKVVQRIPVRIALADLPQNKPLRAGMSVDVKVDVRK